MENKQLKKRSIFLLLCVLILSGIALFEAKEIKVDYDFDRFFPKDDPELIKYNNYTKNFNERDDDFILIGILNPSGIFNEKFLQKIKNCGDKIQKLNNIREVTSPCHNCFYIKESGLIGFEKKDCISFQNFQEDSIRIDNNKKLIGSIFSKNSPAISFLISTEPNLTKNKSEKLLSKINEIIKHENFSQVHIAGKIITVKHYTTKMQEELLFFFIASIILVCLFLWISYKTWWTVLIPLIIILTTIIWTVAIMVITGKKFDILMVMLPTIIFVVGMSDLIHFINRYIEELRNGNKKITAIKTSFKEVGLATLLTSLTTAIGFFSLLAVEIIPIKEFGIYSGISVLVAYVLSFLCLPLFLIILPQPKKLMVKEKSFKWRFTLGKSFIWVLKNQKTILISSAILFVIGIISASQLKVNTFILEDLQENDPLKKSYSFFETNFSGVRPLEIALYKGVKSTNIYDYSTAKQIEKLEQYLENKYTDSGAGFIISPLDPIKYIYSIKHNNNPDYFRLPSRERQYNNAVQLFKSYKGDEVMNSYITKDSSTARISGKIHDLGSYVMKQENKKLQDFVTDSIDANYLKIQITGTPMLLDSNNEKLSGNILLGLIIAFVIIGLIVGIIYKSWIIIGISLIVNILPLLFITIIMQLFHFDIKTSTALIFTLAFGIAVDDTIHLLSKLKLELNKSKSVLWALKRSYLSTGKAIIVTTLILCGGFLTLIASNFSSVFSMGLLISTTLFIAVIIDLTLLPTLLILGRKSIQKTASQSNHSIDSH